VVATGIDAVSSAQPAQAPAQAHTAPRPENLSLVPGGGRPPGMRPAVMTSPAAAMAAPRRVGVSAAAPMVLRAPASHPAAAAAPSASLGPVAVPAPEDAEGGAPAAHAAAASPPSFAAPVDPARRAAAGPAGAAASTVPGVSNGIRRIFQEMTGAGLMRRNQAAAPPPPPSPAARNPDPAARQPGGPTAQRPPQPEEIGLDIPTFLRRQSN
jgi:hypothetical protein